MILLDDLSDLSIYSDYDHMRDQELVISNDKIIYKNNSIEFDKYFLVITRSMLNLSGRISGL